MIIATDTRLRLKISDTYRFAVVCLPASAYFAHPIRIKVERQFVRAATRRTGAAKCGGQLRRSLLYPTRQAQERRI